MSNKEAPRQTVRTKGRVEFELLAKEIGRLRDKSGLSKRGLSMALGRDPNFIFSVERGLYNPDFATYCDIFKFLGADPRQVFWDVVSEAMEKKPSG